MDKLEALKVLFGINADESGDGGASQPEQEKKQTEQETKQTEQETKQTEQETKGKETSGAFTKDDLRMMIRETLTELVSEKEDEQKKRQEAARAAGVVKVPEDNKRTIDDIMAERYKSVMGTKEKEKEN